MNRTLKTRRKITSNKEVFFRRMLSAILLLGMFATMTSAQDGADAAGEDERDSTFKHWRWMFELRLPEKIDTPYLAVDLPPDVFGKSRGALDKDGELADLRLADAKGTRVPFVMRPMNETFSTVDMPIQKTFNAAPNMKSRTYEATYDLGMQPPTYNEIEIFTTQKGNYRRKVEVLGDDNEGFENPKSILGKNKYLVYYNVDGRIVDVHKFHFKDMRYQYLQVRVYADDPTVDEEIPTITNFKVRRVIATPGESATEQATLDKMQPTRGDGGPGTAWFIVFPESMPVHKLTFEVSSEASERPMRLEVAEENQAPLGVGIIEKNWRRPDKLPQGPDKLPQGLPEMQRNVLEVRFNEAVAKRLRLVITDFANPPLQLNSVKATRWVRKLIFEKPDETKITLPLRLYSGNTSVSRAGFQDLANKLAEPAKVALTSATLDSARENPSFEPPPKTLQERMPSLVYWVLGGASFVLLLILLALVKQAITRHDAAEKTAASGTPS